MDWMAVLLLFLLPNTPSAQSDLPGDLNFDFLSNPPSLFPSMTPSLTPKPSLVPSESPSFIPTQVPSIHPSFHPSFTPSTGLPSFSPSDMPTPLPTITRIPSDMPSNPPTIGPTSTARPSNSPKPSERPSHSPTFRPSHPPSNLPSISPTDTFFPSMGPSMSAKPSYGPTESPAPTASPSMNPTITPKPTNDPSISPTDFPSFSPSEGPTALPTFSQSFLNEGFFLQAFVVGNGREFPDDEVATFEAIMEGYTANISGTEDASRINTTCIVTVQRILKPVRYLRQNMEERRLEDVLLPQGDETVNQVEYTVSWFSIHVNLTDYISMFASFINANLGNVTLDLQNGGLNVTESRRLLGILVTEPPSTSPSTSPLPSVPPSDQPTGIPSIHPSSLESNAPTIFPSEVPSSSLPSNVPTPITITPAPTPAPTPGSGPNNAALGVSLTLVILILLGGGGYFLYRRRKKKKEMLFQATAASGVHPLDGDPTRFGKLSVDTGDPYRNRDLNETPKSDDNVVGMISPSDSLLSNQSLLSAGNSMGGDTVDEADGTHHLADEFDQYKDQNLEKMRTDVEETVTGADGMMSQAMTMALMGDDDPVADQNELYWGSSGDPAEIEASALCEVNDFLKRKEGAGLEERRTFMQDTMNKMVLSVRHGVLEPEGASRTIHECAAMLGLELASSIPENTVIVTGLRKTVTKSDLEVAFKEFGDIDVAAVASSARGFGLVRFVSPQSVQRTMNKFRHGEIVVQDVAVMVRVLKSDGAPWHATSTTAASTEVSQR